MEFSIIAGIGPLPGIAHNCNQGILIDEQIYSITVAKAKRDTSIIVRENPVIASAIKANLSYAAIWTKEAVTAEGRPFWSKLYPFYCAGLVYIHLIELPSQSNSDIDSNTTEDRDNESTVGTKLFGREPIPTIPFIESNQAHKYFTKVEAIDKAEQSRFTDESVLPKGSTVFSIP